MIVALAVAHAEEPTLAAYMDAAVAHHPRAEIARAATETAAADTAEAGAALLPTVRGSASYAYNQYESVADFGPAGEIVIVPHDELRASVDLRVPLVDAPAVARWRGLRHAADAADADERAAEQDLRLDVARAWYAAQVAEQVVLAAERAKGAADENARFLTIRAEAGAATTLSVQRAELEVANADLLVIDGRRAWQTALRTLATLSGLPEPASLPVVPAVPEALPPEADLLAAATRDRPELASGRAKVDELHAASGGAWLSYAPTVAGTASEQITNAAGFSGQDTAYRVGVALDWLLLDLGDRNADVRRARAALAVAEAELRQQEDAVRDEVHAAWLATDAAAARVEAARRGADVGTAASADVREKFQAGTATQVEVIQAERDALDAEVTRIRAEGDLAVARLALLRAAGQPIAP